MSVFVSLPPIFALDSPAAGLKPELLVPYIKWIFFFKFHVGIFNNLGTGVCRQCWG